MPGAAAQARVGKVTPRDGYLGAFIIDDTGSMRFFFEASPECQRVIKPEQIVEYRQTGVVGRVVYGDDKCDPIGIAALEEWRQRRAMPPRAGSMAPRDFAS